MANLSILTSMSVGGLPIPERSEATPGLWNNLFSVLSQNLDQVNSDGGAAAIAIPPIAYNVSASIFTFIGASNLSSIQSAINKASTSKASLVYVPQNYLPYDPSKISFINTVQMVREGGNWSVNDIIAYGGNGAASDDSAFQAALNGATLANGSVRGVFAPASIYTLKSFVSLYDGNAIQFDAGTLVTLSGYSAGFQISIGNALLGSAMGAAGGVNGHLGSVLRSNHTGAAPIVLKGNALYNIIQNIGIDGQTRGFAQGFPAIMFTVGGSTSNRNRFNNISIQQYAGTGIDLNNSTDNQFVGVSMSNCGSTSGGSFPGFFIRNGSNSNHFVNIQMDSTYFAGIQYGTTSNLPIGDRWTNIKIDTNAAPSGTECIEFDEAVQIITFENVQLRADVAGVGTAVVIPKPVKGITFIGGYINRVEAAAGIGFKLNDPGAQITIDNFSFVSLGIAIQDSTSTGNNQYTNLQFYSCTTDYSFLSGAQRLSGLLSSGIQVDLTVDGAALSPAMAFASEASLGLYRSTASILALSYGTMTAPGMKMTTVDRLSGTTITFIAPISVGTIDTNSYNNQALLVQASSGIPGYSIMLGSTLQALYYVSTNSVVFQSQSLPVAFAPGGVTRWQMLTNNQLQGNDGTAATPAYGFISEGPLGWYRSAKSAIGLSYGQLEVPAGTALAPSYAISSESSLGIYRSAASTLALSYGTLQLTSGGLTLATAGDRIRIKNGTNASFGTAVLGSVGSVNVPTNIVTANSIVFLTDQTAGGTLGQLSVGAMRAGSGFTITSSNIADTSTIAWLVIEPSP